VQGLLVLVLLLVQFRQGWRGDLIARAPLAKRESLLNCPFVSYATRMLCHDHERSVTGCAMAGRIEFHCHDVVRCHQDAGDR